MIKKNIEKIVNSEIKNFKIEIIEGKIIIVFITDYCHSEKLYHIKKHLTHFDNERSQSKVSELLKKLIPENLLVIKQEEINIPVSVKYFKKYKLFTR